MGIVANETFTQPIIGNNYSGDSRTLRQIITSMFSATNPLRIEVIGTGNPGDNGWCPVFSIVTSSAKRVLKLVDWVSGTGTKPTIPTDNYVGSTGLVEESEAIDIRGPIGVTGISVTGTSYNPSTGIVIFTYSDSSTTSTGDLRGAVGVGISNIEYNSETQVMTFILTNTSTIPINVPIPDPNKAWAPVFVGDSTTVSGKYFLKLIDYVGGTGDKPALPVDVDARFIGTSGYTDSSNAFDFKGTDGDDGDDGVGIASTSYNSGTGELTITFTDESTYVTGDLRGADGFGSEMGSIGTVNMNAEITYGKYFCTSINDLTNGPTSVPGDDGFIDILVSGSNICQIVYLSGKEIWMRKSNNGGSSWSSWVQS